MIETRNPATGEVLATLPSAGAEDVDRAVIAAREALPAWSADGRTRGRLLNALAERIRAKSGAIATMETTDNGRPIRETSSQASIVADWFTYFAGLADKIEGATIPVQGSYLNYTTRVPVGVCAALTPWNHPLLIASKKLAPALACGNTIVLKPSELAPLSVLEVARFAREAGFPEGVVTVISGGPETGRALVAHPGVDRIDLTGSSATGIAVATEAAKGMKRLGFELGGKAANIVFADADLDRAVRGAVFAGYIGQGQTCIAGSRLLAERSIAGELTKRMVEQMERIAIGNPLDVATQMGPLITPEAADRTAAIVDEAAAAGATVMSGGAKPSGLSSGLSPAGFYRPTLIAAEDPQMRIAQEEIFGPVVTTIPFDGEAQAIEIGNDVAFGLGSAVWTRDISRAHRVAAALRSGTVWVNDYHRTDPASPWGGFGMSGYGRENGLDSIHEFTEVKSTWIPTEEQPIDWYDSDELGSRLN